MMTRRRSPVPRAIRIVNLLVLLLFLAGAGLYGWAWLGLERLKDYQAAAGGEPFAGVAEFTHYWELSRVGIWLVLAAVAIAVAAAIATVVLQRRRDG